MKRKGKIWFFVVAILIFVLAYTTVAGVSTRYGDTTTPVVRGVSDIRFGIDIRGGVDVTFVPADGTVATSTQMDGAKAVIENRLIALGITDYEIYKDSDKSRIILRFPWQAEETEFDPETAIQELAATSSLTFRNGTDADEEGNPTGDIILTGSDITSATASYGVTNSSGTTAEHYVSLVLNSDGTQKFATATAELAQTGGAISIWMDNTMISAPTVNEAITTGTASISGSFDAESAQSLADKINAGALPFALKAESYSTISPTLGSQSLEAMVIAGVIALCLVCLFMLAFYRLVGFVSCIAIVGQVAATLALISRYFVVFPSFTLTLPGIAGIILAIGMGVDANVITAERIKEELRGGKKLDSAIKSGFVRGLAPIIDGNVTVLIVAAILMGAFGPTDGFFAYLLKPVFFAFGVSTAGSIYAFGYTLMVGVVLNFVFGVFFTRVMLTSISKFKAMRNPVLYGGLPKGKEAKPPLNINFVGNRKKYFIFSGALMGIILLVSIIFGVPMDVQFKGGAIVTYSYTGEVDTSVVQGAVNGVLGDQAVLQLGENAAAGTTLTITLPGDRTLDVQILEELSNALTEEYPDNGFTQLSVNNVTATIGKEFLLKSVIAVVLASVLILLYIAFRFRNIGGWQGGFTAVVALVHDLLIIYGVFVCMRIPLNSNFIAAVLTILGYSINDTVVIYDRVRENRGLYGKKLSFAENVNLSINQSFRRSVNTSVTTMMALGCVCVVSVIYGLESIFTFAFPLMIGMISGVYSTVCLAGPLWVILEKNKQAKGKKGVKKPVKAVAAPAAAVSKAKAAAEEEVEVTYAVDISALKGEEPEEEADGQDDAEEKE
ncbi:MAG: protein translocase subunit SecF [Oscillospiraceae bacterium]